ncbi:hypothetical protein ONS95_004743 [Cadophora gregata]|uniref:uncharacterized protein n=1 Tax=Cadophora gregata TaxID=51156 RepID=UPI0026DD4B00|nr:uncharacterized protein ONS95_004743 [Cadophora gregata]KAK0104454.1 hypothetical protein ONS95_004743 [Cadophora gregata]
MANPPFSTYYSAKDIPDKGRGLFAKQDLPVGFLLFEDEPLFTPSTLLKDIGNNLGFCCCSNLQIRAIPDVNWRLAFRGLQNAFADFPNAKCHELGIYKTNCVRTEDDKETVFRILSLMNHSCTPNAFYSFHKGSQKARVHIIRTILAGEEITRDYGTLSELNRRLSLREMYNIHCDCPTCMHGFRVSPHSLHFDFYKLLTGFKSSRILPDQPRRRYGLLGLKTMMLLRDGICDGRLSKVIEEAFQIAAGQDDLRRARVWQNGFYTDR